MCNTEQTKYETEAANEKRKTEKNCNLITWKIIVCVPYKFDIWSLASIIANFDSRAYVCVAKIIKVLTSIQTLFSCITFSCSKYYTRDGVSLLLHSLFHYEMSCELSGIIFCRSWLDESRKCVCVCLNFYCCLISRENNQLYVCPGHYAHTFARSLYVCDVIYWFFLWICRMCPVSNSWIMDVNNDMYRNKRRLLPVRFMCVPSAAPCPSFHAKTLANCMCVYFKWYKW